MNLLRNQRQLGITGTNNNQFVEEATTDKVIESCESKLDFGEKNG